MWWLVGRTFWSFDSSVYKRSKIQIKRLWLQHIQRANPEKKQSFIFPAYLSYSVVKQTEAAWQPSWPVHTPHEMNDCLWQWTSPALCPLALGWLFNRGGGNTDKLKLEPSCSHRTRSKPLHKGVLSAWKRQLRLRRPRPIFTLVSGNVRLVPELGRVLNKLHSVLLTAKVCETQIKRLYVRFRDWLWPKCDTAEEEKNEVAETLSKSRCARMTNRWSTMKY